MIAGPRPLAEMACAKHVMPRRCAAGCGESAAWLAGLAQPRSNSEPDSSRANCGVPPASDGVPTTAIRESVAAATRTVNRRAQEDMRAEDTGPPHRNGARATARIAWYGMS